MAQTLRLLIIEDSEDDTLLAMEELRKGGYDPEFTRVDTPQALDAALENVGWDAVIADYNLPSFTGLDALRIVQAKRMDVPFILVSGAIGEEKAASAMKAGCHDFIMKGHLSRLAQALERELREAVVRREHGEAVEALRRAHAELEQRVAERTAELQAANTKLLDSRRAALNMMEDADIARRRAEALSADLLTEIMERKRIEEELRRAHDELEKRVKERTEELVETIDILQVEIGARERIEASLLRLNRLYSVLGEIDQSIVRVNNRDALFRDFCRIAVEHGGFLLSWVGLVDEGSGEIRKVAAFGATGYLDGIRITAYEEPAGTGPTGIAIREGTYFICNDFQSAPCTSPWHESGRNHGIKSSASVALSSDGNKLVAVDCTGQIYTSSDFGTTWRPTSFTSSAWISVASTADGTKLFALAEGGAMYTSQDSGSSWTVSTSSINWTSIASSADGSKLVAVAQDDKIYTLN